MSIKIQTYNEILINMISDFIASQDIVNDINVGAPLMRFFAAVARGNFDINLSFKELEKASFIDTAEGADLDRYGDFFNWITNTDIWTRKGSTTAMSERSLLVHGTEGTAINEGDLFTASDDRQYTCTKNTTIGADGLAIVRIEAINPGSRYNAGIGAIDAMLNPRTGIITIKNTERLYAVDEETDRAYKNRLKSFWSSMQSGTRSGIQSTTLSVEGVDTASLINNTPVDGTTTIIIADSQGEATDELIESVRTTLEGDGTIENPGKLNDGIVYEIKAPFVVSLIPEVLYDKITRTISEIIADVEAITDRYIQEWNFTDRVIIQDLYNEIKEIEGLTLHTFRLFAFLQPTAITGVKIVNYENPDLINKTARLVYNAATKSLSYNGGNFVAIQQDKISYVLRSPEGRKLSILAIYSELNTEDVRETLTANYVSTEEPINIQQSIYLKLSHVKLDKVES